MAAPAKHPPPWIFGVSCIPYGVVGSFVATVMPYLAAHQGIDLGEIGGLTAAAFVPAALQFLYAPIVDVGPKRKHWLVIVAAIGAVMLMVATAIPIRTHEGTFLAFTIAANFLTGLVSACNGGLMAVTMPDSARGRAGAWYNAGNLSGGAISAALALWMIDANYTELSVGAMLAVMMFLPALAILAVDEPDRDHVAHVRELFGTAWGDAKRVLLSRQGYTGVLLFLSPVATAALTNFFSGMAKDYNASEKAVFWVNGWANVGLTFIGTIAGGYLCDRFNRRVLYLVAGLLTAACGISMALSARTELTYIWGTCQYFLITGFCYAAYGAAVLETIGDAGKTASTQYALFNATSNVAIAWVGLVDTRFAARWHVEGVVAADAGLNVIGVIVLAIVFWRLGAFGKWRHREA